MKKFVPVIAAFLLSSLVFWGCEKATIFVETPDVPYHQGGPVDSVKFHEHLVPIFNNECTGCHSIGGGLQPELEEAVAYNSIIDGGYVNTANPASSIIYTTIEPATTTHGGGQHKEAADKILIWIQQGARNN